MLSRLRLRDLDFRTRTHMLLAFEDEWRQPEPPKPKDLSGAGVLAWPALMKRAIREGNDATLAADLSNPDYWLRKKQVHDVTRKASLHAQYHFNRLYVQGLAARLRNEGEGVCVVYRAADSRACKNRPCSAMEQCIVDLEQLLPSAGAIVPSSLRCRHSVHRLAVPRPRLTALPWTV